MMGIGVWGWKGNSYFCKGDGWVDDVDQHQDGHKTISRRCFPSTVCLGEGIRDISAERDFYRRKKNTLCVSTTQATRPLSARNSDL